MKNTKRATGVLFSLVLLLILLTRIVPVSAEASSLSQGVQNIVKRAYQMTNIQWTPQKDIVGWGGGVTYRAGVTYTGLPYGQPVYASYVPWSTNLDGFIAAVNNSSSKMYTSYSTYNQRAPYYSIDCSAFVSWAWGLSSRQTTKSIANYATQISTSSYENAQVGDCLNLSGSHVVLITDITYDSSGNINSIEISESTVAYATNYCCQRTRYGVGGTQTLNQLVSKYFGSGYILYRSKTRDSVTYSHSCVSPLEGDICTKCNYGNPYLLKCDEYPCYVTLTTPKASKLWNIPCSDATSSDAKEMNKTSAGETLTAVALYKNTENNYWYKIKYGDAFYYLYGGNASNVETKFDDIKITDPVAPSQIQKGNVFAIGGNVTASYNQFDSITARVTGPQKLESSESGSFRSYPLKGSKLDKELTFNTLPVGSYSYVIEVDVTNYYTEDGKSLDYSGLFLPVYRTSFTVVSSGSSPVESKITCEVTSPAEGQTVPKAAFPVIGTVISNYPLSCVEGYIDGTKYATVNTTETTLALRGTDINNKLSFGDLASGKHTLVIKAKDTNSSEFKTVMTRVFYTEEVLEESKDPGKPELLEMVSEYTTEDKIYFVWNATANTTHYNLYVEKQDLDGTYVDFDAYHYAESEMYVVLGEGNYRVQLQSTNADAGWVYTNSDYFYFSVKHAHSYSFEITSPTCTTEGYTTNRCSSCGDTFQSNFVLPTGHSFQNGVCTVCGAKDTSIVKGDLNQDGDVTSADAVLLARYLVDLQTLTEQQLLAADLNGDGSVTSADAVLIAKLLINV